ncbi:MAG: sugar transferase [Candidatus Hodarchaeota archaeon]
MKRLLDILISIIGLVILAPVMLMIMILIKLTSKAPIFLRQNRPGKNGKVFCLYKFRSMRDLRDKDGDLLPEDKRLTKIGNFLRKSSLDELPELWNILKGDMSVVGPRPLLVEYLNRYTQEQARRHEVKPGITGWAQIHGRNAITWEEKFKYDVWYVDNRSICLDIKIILITIIKVIKGEGIRHPGYATMEEFKGSNLREQ